MTKEERNKEYKKQWYLKNKDRIKKSHKEDNTIKSYKKEWYIKNKEKAVNNAMSYHNIKYNSDSLYKIKVNVRGLITQSLKKGGFKKTTKTQQILGCTFEEFKLYLESKFESWMNWENKGNWNGQPTEINTAWDIDHIIPLSSATNEIELLKLNNYTNLQPLCSYTNRFIKRDKK